MCIRDSKGTYQSKKIALEKAGVEVLATPSAIGAALDNSGVDKV